MSDFSGKCLCGEVAFTATGEAQRVSACYCSMCRKQNGGGAFHGAELRGELTITNDAGLKWYASSDKARRGFCKNCGSTMFWQSIVEPAFFDISLGVLDDVSGLELDTHIFVDEAACYQTLPDNARLMTADDVLASPLQDQ